MGFKMDEMGFYWNLEFENSWITKHITGKQRVPTLSDNLTTDNEFQFKGANVDAYCNMFFID